MLIANAIPLVYVNFNQDGSLFSAGTDNGFRIYSLSPFAEKANVQKVGALEGGFSIVELLYKTNLIALVGQSKSFPRNRLVLFDFSQSQIVFEIEFQSEIKAVRMRRDRLVVVLKNQVFVYSIGNHPIKIASFETIDNDNGLVAFSTGNAAVLAIPGKSKGQVQVIEFTSSQQPNTPVPAPTAPAPVAASNPGLSSNPNYLQSTSVVAAHESNIACISISSNGQFIATASEKGTLIRVFDGKTGKKIQELRRGMDPAQIYSIQFNSDNSRICVASDKGTVHVFNFKVEETGNSTSEPNLPEATASSGNRQSSLSFLAPYLPKYFSSEWSFAYFKLPVDTTCICGFIESQDQKENLGVLCSDGSVYRYSFDREKGGEATREAFNWFIKDF